MRGQFTQSTFETIIKRWGWKIALCDEAKDRRLPRRLEKGRLDFCRSFEPGLGSSSREFWGTPRSLYSSMPDL